jgi:hypothetical protein
LAHVVTIQRVSFPETPSADFQLTAWISGPPSNRVLGQFNSRIDSTAYGVQR